MAFSYNISLATPLDQIRFLIQDTKSTRVIFQDEEILASMYGDGSTPGMRYSTAIYLVRRQIALFAKDADYELQSEKLKASQRYKQMQGLLDSLLEESIVVSGVIAVPTSTTSNDTIFGIGCTDNDT